MRIIFAVAALTALPLAALAQDVTIETHPGPVTLPACQPAKNCGV